MHKLVVLFYAIIFSLSAFAQTTWKLPAKNPVAAPAAAKFAKGKIATYHSSLEANTALFSENYFFYKPTNTDNAKKNPVDNVRVVRRFQETIFFAKLKVYGGEYLWVILPPGTALRHERRPDGTVNEAPFALDECGNSIVSIAYPKPPAVPAPAAVTSVPVPAVAAPECVPPPAQKVEVQLPQPERVFVPPPPAPRVYEPKGFAEDIDRRTPFEPKKTWTVGKVVFGVAIGTVTVVGIASLLKKKDSAPAKTGPSVTTGQP